MSIAEKLQTIAENEQRVYEAGIEEGKKAEHDAWWEVYQQGGKPMAVNYMFAFDRWTDAVYKPKYPIRSSSSTISNTFYSSGISDTVVDIDARGVQLAATFSYAYSLKKVRKLMVDESTTYNNPFNGTRALVELGIEGTIGQNGFNVSPCTLLSHDSLMSIINALKSGVSGLTVTLGSTNLAKLTDAEKAIATQKGWTLA